jgi:ketosteroid isomerase-like protein
MLTASAARSGSRLDEFSRWLTAFGDAWEAGDADAVAALFTAGATLQPTPFLELVRGRRAIRDHFAGLYASWPGASFAAQVLGAGDTYGIAHWSVSSGSRARDGVMVAAFDGRGRCTSLRQWWHDSP